MAETKNNIVNTPTAKAAAPTAEKEELQRGSDTAIEIAVFFGTLTLAYFSGWLTKDLIWSLWLSSLMVGFLSVAVSSGRRIIRPDATMVERVFSFIGAIFAIWIWATFQEAHCHCEERLDATKQSIHPRPVRDCFGRLRRPRNDIVGRRASRAVRHPDVLHLSRL